MVKKLIRVLSKAAIENKIPGHTNMATKAAPNLKATELQDKIPDTIT